jgi:DNA-binding NarL/FixJ family response regulator
LVQEVTMRIPVSVSADDPVTKMGVAAQLRGRPEVLVVEAGDRAEVAVVATERLDETALVQLRSIQRNDCARVVLIVNHLDDTGVLVAAKAGVCALLRRVDATPERLAGTVASATRGEGVLPPDLLGRLLDQVGRLQDNVLGPQGLTFGGLTEREVDVLRLVADGMDTVEIAESLCYSERTVKNAIHDVTRRFQLRNRSHAVAFALRQGLI